MNKLLGYWLGSTMLAVVAAGSAGATPYSGPDLTAKQDFLAAKANFLNSKLTFLNAKQDFVEAKQAGNLSKLERLEAKSDFLEAKQEFLAAKSDWLGIKGAYKGGTNGAVPIPGTLLLFGVPFMGFVMWPWIKRLARGLL